jgi:hypothetical protein
VTARSLLLSAVVCSLWGEAPKTAIATGARIPDFESIDQDGKRQTFDTIKGSSGAFLLFHRSADW